VGFVLLTLASGCFDVKSVPPDVEVTPDGTGVVSNAELGIRGQWFAYGDKYDWPHSCTNDDLGHHLPEECSKIDMPSSQAPDLGFVNQDGRMCTSGQVGRVLMCDSMGENAVVNCNNTDWDFSNMWGAGIGLDFDVDTSSGQRDPLARKAWDAPAHHVVGMAFDYEGIDDTEFGTAHLRIEFPILLPANSVLKAGEYTAGLNPMDGITGPSDGSQPYPDNPTPSEEHPEGSPWLKAPAIWPKARNAVSPVLSGHNLVYFSDVNPAPESEYAFNLHKLLGIQFHVPSFENDDKLGQHFGYGFCISHLTFLRE
jgi:hypothetical protein